MKYPKIIYINRIGENKYLHTIHMIVCNKYYGNWLRIDSNVKNPHPGAGTSEIYPPKQTLLPDYFMDLYNID